MSSWANFVGDSFKGACHPSEAHEKHVHQLSASGCGATAVVTLLLLLEIISSKEEISSLDYSCCILRKRQNDAPVARYLRSRFDAGCTGAELIESMQRLIAANNLQVDVEAEFVSYASLQDRFEGKLLDFLAEKFESGWVAVATLNLQVHGNDAWHHQVIYGVDKLSRHAYLMNPLESRHEALLEVELDSQSVLLIRKDDILSRLDRPEEDDAIFDDPQWKPFNVRAQIEAVRQGFSRSPFVVIPAAYTSGFAFFRRKVAD